MGYPTTKNFFKAWYQEYEREQDLQVHYSHAPSNYSAEQKQWAVQHYLDHDQCIASTLRALGYLCRDLLTRWFDELHPQLRRSMVCRAPNIKHSPEVKNAAVLELCTSKTDALTVAESVGMCRPTLYNWKNQLLGREATASIKRRQTSQAAPKRKDLTELEQHVALLERNLRRLQLEHDLINKANELQKKACASPRNSLAIGRRSCWLNCWASWTWLEALTAITAPDSRDRTSIQTLALLLPTRSEAITVATAIDACALQLACDVYPSQRKSYNA
jgi:transposase-like protein